VNIFIQIFIYAAYDHLPIVGFQREVVDGAWAVLLARKATRH
jgi:hypothetical protein